MYSGVKTNPWKVWNGECQDIQDILIISNKTVSYGQIDIIGIVNSTMF